MAPPPLSIVVLLGGPSAERPVSLRSGDAVAAALAAEGHRVQRFDPHAGRLDPAPLGTPQCVQSAGDALRGYDWRGVDVIFNALHGPFGEDGQAQRILDELQLPYTGSGPTGSSLGFFKSLAKQEFARHGLSTPRGIRFDAHASLFTLDQAASRLSYPVVVKPEAQGSSLGVTIVPAPDRLPAAVAAALAIDTVAILEEYIPGTEWTVPLWDDEVLPLIQIVPAVGFFDYAAKYSDERTEYRFEFDAAPETLRRIADAGLRAAQSLGLQGFSRADIRLTPDGRPFVLEVNSSPGMTDHSLVPKSAARAGWSLGRLCTEECRRALRRRG